MNGSALRRYRCHIFSVFLSLQLTAFANLCSFDSLTHCPILPYPRSFASFISTQSSSRFKPPLPKPFHWWIARSPARRSRDHAVEIMLGSRPFQLRGVSREQRNGGRTYLTSRTVHELFPLGSGSNSGVGCGADGSVYMPSGVFSPWALVRSRTREGVSRVQDASGERTLNDSTVQCVDKDDSIRPAEVSALSTRTNR